MQKQKVATLESRKLHFPKGDYDGATIWPQNRLKREWSRRANPPYMTLFPWKLFPIYTWFCVILRGYFMDATLLVG